MGGVRGWRWGLATAVELREGSREAAAVFIPGDERWAALADESRSRRWWMSEDLGVAEGSAGCWNGS